MGSVYCPTRKDSKTGKHIKYGTCRIVYTDANGNRKAEKAFRDRDASIALLRKRERQVERRKASLPVAEEGRRLAPIDEVIEKYIAELSRQGRSHTHKRDSRRLLKTLWRECGWKCIGEIRTDGLRAYVQKLQTVGCSVRTLNSSRDALIAFCNWCVEQRYLEESPVRLRKAKAEGGRMTRPRRAYTVKEFDALLKATLHHQLIYRIAGLSGLRKERTAPAGEAR
jgi:hypothetical protein